MKYVRIRTNREWGGDPIHWWGEPTTWMEVNARGHAERQIDFYPNGYVLSFDQSHAEDPYGGLALMVVEGEETWWKAHEVSPEDFEECWRSHAHSARNRVSQSSGSAPEGFTYVGDFLSVDEHCDLESNLEKLEYTHDVFRGQRLKRAYAQFGYAYVSTGRKLNATDAIPEFLAAVMAKAFAHCPSGTTFNQCIVTRYPKDAGIGWHTDAPAFADCIAGITVTSEGHLQFRPDDAEQITFEIATAPGSLYVMHGPARWHYQHQVLPVKTLRYSLTFRRVIESDRRPD